MCILQLSRGRSSELSLKYKQFSYRGQTPTRTVFNEISFLSVRMYSNCTGPGFALHSDIAVPYISNYGSKEQIERFIPEATAGRCICAIAMTEPGAGRSGVEHRRDVNEMFSSS